MKKKMQNNDDNESQVGFSFELLNCVFPKSLFINRPAGDYRCLKFAFSMDHYGYESCRNRELNNRSEMCERLKGA